MPSVPSAPRVPMMRKTADRKQQDFSALGDSYDIIFDAVGKFKGYGCSNPLIARMFDESRISAIIDKTYPMNEVVSAHRYLETGRRRGI